VPLNREKGFATARRFRFGREIRTELFGSREIRGSSALRAYVKFANIDAGLRWVDDGRVNSGGLARHKAEDIFGNSGELFARHTAVSLPFARGPIGSRRQIYDNVVHRSLVGITTALQMISSERTGRENDDEYPTFGIYGYFFTDRSNSIDRYRVRG